MAMNLFSFDRIYIEISNVCNLACSFCPPLARNKQIMSIDDFKRIIYDCAPHTKQVFLHLMGEPLIHPDFAAIINLCQDARTPVQITTNGTLLTQEMQKILSSPIIRQINFSLQCLEDNFPGEDPAIRIIPILDFCKDLHQENSDIYINFRFWNTDEIRNDRELDIIENYYQLKINRRTEKGAIKSKKIGDHLYLHFDTRFEWPTTLSQYCGDVGTCHGLNSQIAILADGRVVPCCLDKDGLMSLGNCLDTSLINILNSSRALAIRDGFKNGNLVEELCQHCRYISRFDKKVMK